MAACTFCGDEVRVQVESGFSGGVAKPGSGLRIASRNLVDILCQAANIQRTPISTDNSQNNYCSSCDKLLTEIATSYAQLQRQLLQIKAILLQRNRLRPEFDREEGQIQRILVQELNPFLVLERISTSQDASSTDGGVVHNIFFPHEPDILIKTEPLQFDLDFAQETLPEPQSIHTDADWLPSPSPPSPSDSTSQPSPKVSRPRLKPLRNASVSNATSKRRRKNKPRVPLLTCDVSDTKLTPLLDGSYLYCGVVMTLLPQDILTHPLPASKHAALRSYRCGACSRKIRGLYNVKCHLRRVHLRQNTYLPNHVKISGEMVPLDVTSSPGSTLLHGVPVLKLDSGHYQCGNCSVTYPRRFQLLRHIRHTHAKIPKTPRVPFGPKTEAETFRRKGTKMSDGTILFNGVEIKTLPNNRWECGACGATRKLKGGMYQHVQIHHPESRPHTCEICGLSFAYKHLYEAHLVKHATHKPWICEKCGVSLKRKEALKEHDKRVHQGIVNASCASCGKGFYTRKDLRMHERTHGK